MNHPLPTSFESHFPTTNEICESHSRFMKTHNWKIKIPNVIWIRRARCLKNCKSLKLFALAEKWELSRSSRQRVYSVEKGAYFLYEGREEIIFSGLSGHAASLGELKHQPLAFDVGLYLLGGTKTHGWLISPSPGWVWNVSVYPKDQRLEGREPPGGESPRGQIIRTRFTPTDFGWQNRLPQTPKY